MKLFKSLLVAPATLGLLAPLSATANEVTFNDFNPAEELAITNSRVDGLEERLNNFEAGGFSETTVASFKVNMAIGAVDGKDVTSSNAEGDQDVNFQYTFDTKLKTSFTGDDELSIAIDSGNGASGNPVDEFGLNNTADALKVDGVAYKFPVGDGLTVMVADNKDGSSMFTVACAYGGPSNTLDDCGNVNAVIDNGGAMAGAEYDFDNGFTVAVGYAAAETGLMTQATNDAYGLNGAYTADNYGVSLTYGYVETGTNGVTESYYTALNGYYSFDNGLNVSAGYEIGDIGANADSADESINYFLGVNTEFGPGEVGAAIGTHGGQLENQTSESMIEVYYDYPVNDGMTITPLVFVKESATAGSPDQTGVMVKTTFKF